MKKFILILISSIILTILFVICFQYILQLRSQKGALQVTSSPESKVYINGKYLGTTPLCKCEGTEMLQTGDYTIRMIPTKGGLSEFQEKVTISEGVLTVVDRKFAKDSLSEGSVISLTPLQDKKAAELLVASLPEGTTVFLDSNKIGNTPILFKHPTESDHTLKITKNGYKDKIIRIRTPLGYKLTVAAYLSINNDLSADQNASASATQSGTGTPTPSPTPLSGTTVIILDTPTGFLRVRDSIGGAEIGRVNPEEEYKFVDEKEGWFEIKLKDGTNGWISNQFAKKQ